MYTVIVNPISGNGRAMRTYRKLMKHNVYKRKIKCTFFTKYIGHATEITEKISKSFQAEKDKGIIIIGGDGTLHEVLNGLTNKQIPISFIAGGSGNDFARGLNISRRSKTTMNRIFQEHRHTCYWLGNYDMDSENNGYFANGIGFGFDAHVAESANESRLKKIFNLCKLGTLNYLIAVLKQLFLYKPINITLTLDGKKKQFKRCFFVTINNHPYVGGGMKINPNAMNEPRHFTILIIHSIRKWKVLLLLLTVFSGKHTRFKEVETYEASKITLQSDTLISYQMDGEIGKTSRCMIVKESQPIRVLGMKQEK